MIMRNFVRVALVGFSALFAGLQTSAEVLNASDCGVDRGGETIIAPPVTESIRPMMTLSAADVNSPARGVFIWAPKIWDTTIHINDTKHALEVLTLAYGTKIPSDSRYSAKYPSGITVRSISGNTVSSADLPENLDEYALVFVIVPYTSISNAQTEKLRAVMARGGRVILQGDHGNYSKVENGYMNTLATNLGAHFQFGSGDLSGGSDTFSVGTCDLLKEALAGYPTSNRLSEFSYSSPAQMVARSGSNVWCVDEPCGAGRLTAFSDMNWYCSGSYSSSAQLYTASIPLLERLLSDAIAREQKVIDDSLYPRLTGLEIISGPSSLEGGASGSYVAEATYEDGSKSNVTSIASWSVTGGSGATFTAPGELKTEVTSVQRSVTVSVSFTYGDTKKATCSLTVTTAVCPASLVSAGAEDAAKECDLVAGGSCDVSHVVENPGLGALTGLKFEVTECPESCEVTCNLPSSIAPKSQVSLVFHVKALAASPTSGWESITIRLTSAEGAVLVIKLSFHAASEKAELSTVEESLASTMAIGEHTEVSFTLVNDSGAASGKIHLSSTAYSWLSFVGAKTLPSLGPGESRTVTLALDPSEANEWAHQAYTGSIVYTCEKGKGGSLGFAFTPVSDKTGALKVTCKDNTGEGATYKAYAGATVSLMDAQTGKEVASGTSDAQGCCSFADLTIGRYLLYVTAPDHDMFKKVVYVHAGETTEVNALMSVATVVGSCEFEQLTIDDEYVIAYQPQIVHVVEAPDVIWTVSPRILAEGDTTVVQMSVRNAGHIRATSVTFAFPNYPAATHHIAFSANGFPLDPGESREVTVRFVCDDCECKGTGLNRVGYATMQVGYTSTDPESGESVTTGYCDGKIVLHGHVPEPVYDPPVLVFTAPVSSGGDRKRYDPDYKLLNSSRVVYKSGNYESSGEPIKWPMIARPDAVVPVTLEIQQPVALSRDIIAGSFVFSNKSENVCAYIHLDLKVQNEEGEDCLKFFEVVATNTAKGSEVPLDGTKLKDDEVTLAALLAGRAGYWFVPKPDAAPKGPVDYYFGGSFIYRIGENGTPQTNDLQFCKMTVSPMPYLKMDYFTQRDVYSDNPFTDVKEVYQPAEFALRIRNEGGGDAKNVRIGSSRPAIVDNKSNLVVNYDLRNWSYESYLDGTSTSLDLDTLELGTIKAGSTRVAEWLFVSTLEGHFTTNGQARLEYTKPWQNSSTTQISEDIGVHLLVHRCDGDGDGIVDFLTSEKSTGAPDKLWCSSADDPVSVNTNAVAEVVGDASLTGESDTLTLTVTSEAAGPVYASAVVDDARTYRVSALSCAGTELPLDNAWATDRTYVPADLTTAFGSRPIREGRIHIFDIFDAPGTRTYTVTLTPRFAFVVGAAEAGYRIGDTYSTNVTMQTEERKVQRYCSGWTALCDGEPVASGDDGAVSFALTDPGCYETSLEWSTNYWICATNADNGSVRIAPVVRMARMSLASATPRFASAEQTASEDWYAAGSSVRLVAVPKEGYSLDCWTGDIESCTAEGETLIVPVDDARTISAQFKAISQTVRLGDAGHSATIPPAGELVCDYWSVVTAEVAQARVDCGPTQYVCKGWAATNADPLSDKPELAIFTVRGDVTLEWFWQTNVVTLAEAVNAADLTWTTGGAREWTPEWNTDAADGDHQAVIGPIGAMTNAWIETTVTGPGTLSFRWKSALAGKNTKMRFYADGESGAALAYTNDWKNIDQTFLGKGTHVFRWSLVTGRSGAADGDWGALDGVVWTPAVPPTLGEALNTNLAWTAEGDVSWEAVARESISEDREAWACVSGLGDDESASLVTRVYGSGVLSFDWAVSCEEELDSFEVEVDGDFQTDISGEKAWVSKWIEIKGECWHTVRWTYVKDEADDPALVGDNLALLDNVVWQSGAGLPPSVAGDDGATVTGNVTDGFVLTPSAGRTAVTVNVPASTSADKVTVVVPHDLASIVPNGAKLRIMKGAIDLTDYLALPSADASGAIALSEAKVKEEVVRETLDPEKGAEVSLDPSAPSLKTAPTKPGLVYTFAEGTTLDALATPQQTHQGDGEAWSPTVSEDESIKSAPSRFFSIGVGK